MSIDTSTQEAAAKAVQELPFTTIAAIAAALSRPEIAETESIQKAYRLLEQAAAGQHFMASLKTKSVIAAVDYLSSYPEKPKDDTAFWNATRLIICDEAEILPVPFEKALKEIIPNPGKGTNRIPYLRKWMMAHEHITDMEAGKKISKWQRDGMPSDVFLTAVDSYRQWRKQETRMVRRKAGLAGANAKKKHGSRAPRAVSHKA